MLRRLRRRAAARATVVSLTFDDGLASHLEAGRTLARHGLVATFFVSSGHVGVPGRLGWSDLDELAGLGHEIGGHTIDHVDLTAVPREEARRQVEADREALRARGHDAASFAYPFGAHSDAVRAVVKRAGYACARRAWGLLREGEAGAWGSDFPPAESLPPADRWSIRTVDGIRPATSLADVQHYVSRADTSNGWVPLVFHDVVDCGGDYSTTPALLEALAEWLSSRQAPVRTVGETASGGVYV